jgi:hypothetical protein
MNSNTSTNGMTTREARVDIKKAKRTPDRASEEIFDIEVKRIVVSVTGESELLQNRFHGATGMEEERALTAEEKKGLKNTPKAPVIPAERYALARITNAAGEDCIEGAKFKAALVTAASRFKEIGVASTVVRGAVFVVGDLIPIVHSGIKPKGGMLVDFLSGPNHAGDMKASAVTLYTGSVPTCGLPRMRRDITRVGKFGSKQPDLRYRPEFRNWSVDLVIEYEPSLITMAGLHQLIRRAGRSIGLYEWRPEKSYGGIFGRFDFTNVVRTRLVTA